MDEREALRIAIERARIRLDEALERAKVWMNAMT